MEPLYYVMAIMGCADTGDACQQARLVPARYQSATACRAAMATMLPRYGDIDYPVVQAACQRSGVTTASQGARNGG